MVSRDGTFERWWSQEGGAIMNGISTFSKNSGEVPLSIWREEAERKMTVYEPGRGSSADTESASASILDILSWHQSGCL